MINEFVVDVCDILNILPPEISYDISNFKSETMMAQCKSDGSIIYIKKIEKQKPELFLSIAHELRHVWQIRTNKDVYLKNYKEVDCCKNIDAYNMQDVELDANGFAVVIMEEFFGIKPMFNNMSNDVKNAIYKRAEEISDTLTK